jgi:SAM-dependent methyltransferase
MILQTNFKVSDGLAAELDIYRSQKFPVLSKPFQRYPDLRSFMDIQSWDNVEHFLDFVALMENIRGKRILDIGCGLGYTSLYLSANENVVTAADPSLECCQVLEWNACRFGLNINIYQTTGEELESLPGEYDIALFHSSLHHMDNPLEALKQSRRKLKPGGTLFLIAESILKFFRSKAWYARMLREHPERIGHYGGNEHVYRSYEYVDMIERAGFSDVRIVPSVLFDRPAQSILRQVYRLTMRTMLRHCPSSLRPLDKLSMLGVSYLAANHSDS